MIWLSDFLGTRARPRVVAAVLSLCEGRLTYTPSGEELAMNALEIDQLLEQAARDRVVPGVVAVVGDRDGTIYEGAFGVLSVDRDAPAQLDTVMWIASLTKAFTSVAALQLVEQGRIELEQPVADILPVFGALPVLEGFDGDEPRVRPPRVRRRSATCSRTPPGWRTGGTTPTSCATTRSRGRRTSPRGGGGRSSKCRWPPTRERAGNTGPAPTGWARWSRRSAAKTSRASVPITSSARWGWPTRPSTRPRRSASARWRSTPARPTADWFSHRSRASRSRSSGRAAAERPPPRRTIFA